MPSTVRRSPRSSLRQRRGPLQDLPLEWFPAVLDTPHKSMSTSAFKPPTKRPRSPSSLMSPTKRRILRDEGLCVTYSAARERRILSQLQVSSNNALFGNRLGILSTAKQGALSSRISDGSKSPATPSKTPSPRAKSASRRRTSPTSFSISPRRKSTRLQTLRSAALPSPPPSPPSPIMVAREVPPSPDRQSIHYPGFDIHYDTHIMLPQSMSRLRVDPDIEADKDASKENRAPRKMAKITPPGKMNIGTLRMKGSLTGGPPGTFGTPAAYSSLRADMLSAMQSPSKYSNMDVWSKRRRMELETDNIYSDDEDDEMHTL